MLLLLRLRLPQPLARLYSPEHTHPPATQPRTCTNMPMTSSSEKGRLSSACLAMRSARSPSDAYSITMERQPSCEYEVCECVCVCVCMCVRVCVCPAAVHTLHASTAAHLHNAFIVVDNVHVLKL